MIIHDIDPVAFSIGSFKVHWYGITYLAGFALAWWLGTVRARQPGSGWNAEQVSDIIFYAAVGVIAGGRLGYMLFYNPFLPAGEASQFWEVWKGGMSFHGGLIGVLIAMWLFGRRYRKGFFEVADFVAPLVPLGLGAGRIGNYINAELWGKVSDLPWAVVFPTGGPLPRHPSMLYEFFLEGVVLFVMLWWFSNKAPPRMAVSGLFLLGYGSFRFLVEFVREPDRQLGYLAFDWFTMGQALSLPMIIGGGALMWWAYRSAKNN
ncbi:prolipoprotein diacylglyceryl transferase [Sulfuriflexus sp.]|uniref:prolipoprotein diacylglyceryl transferase n=1 Tax=Sulfuriflexus sp. TaxID=2015443 RepID=UPI0028CD2FA4|nr:prolipoprotein diacylglyceryl transferase [Sulfuriflexus sp.]MDT8403359.1 prolipoprotein diacylglyceryl transferase [Sulfuriflexus sp.]